MYLSANEDALNLRNCTHIVCLDSGSDVSNIFSVYRKLIESIGRVENFGVGVVLRSEHDGVKVGDHVVGIIRAYCKMVRKMPLLTSTPSFPAIQRIWQGSVIGSPWSEGDP